MVKFMGALALAGVLFAGGVGAAETAKAEKDAAKGDDSVKVYVIGDNKTYHSGECTVIVKAKTDKKDVTEITVKQAKADERKACKRCLDKSSKEAAAEAKAEAKDEGGKKAAAKDAEGKKAKAEGKKAKAAAAAE